MCDRSSPPCLSSSFCINLMLPAGEPVLCFRTNLEAMKKITTEQIEDFFEGRCTQDEAERVVAYLRDNPEVLNSFIRKDWEAAETQGDIPEGYSEEMFREIQEKKKGQRRV